MTDTTEERQSDEIVAEQIRFACSSLGIPDADGSKMARRAIARRAKAAAMRGGID